MGKYLVRYSFLVQSTHVLWELFEQCHPCPSVWASKQFDQRCNNGIGIILRWYVLPKLDDEGENYGCTCPSEFECGDKKWKNFVSREFCWE